MASLRSLRLNKKTPVRESKSVFFFLIIKDIIIFVADK